MLLEAEPVVEPVVASVMEPVVEPVMEPLLVLLSPRTISDVLKPEGPATVGAATPMAVPLRGAARTRSMVLLAGVPTRLGPVAARSVGAEAAAAEPEEEIAVARPVALRGAVRAAREAAELLPVVEASVAEEPVAELSVAEEPVVEAELASVELAPRAAREAEELLPVVEAEVEPLLVKLGPRAAREAEELPVVEEPVEEASVVAELMAADDELSVEFMTVRPASVPLTAPRAPPAALLRGPAADLTADAAWPTAEVAWPTAEPARDEAPPTAEPARDEAPPTTSSAPVGTT